jgi:hypothetical protein
MDILRLRSQKRPAVLLLAIMSWLISATTYSQESQYSAEVKVIKEIRLEGLKRTKEYIVTRELISKVGDPLRQENLDREKNRLELLDIFSDIRIDKEVIGNEVILTYIFVETFPILPSIGLKISDENGVSIGGGVKTPNLLGRDIFFSGRLMFGGSKDVEVWIENPWITGNHLGYSLEYYHRERDNLITAKIIHPALDFISDTTAGMLFPTHAVDGGMRSLLAGICACSRTPASSSRWIWTSVASSPCPFGTVTTLRFSP